MVLAEDEVDVIRSERIPWQENSQLENRFLPHCFMIFFIVGKFPTRRKQCIENHRIEGTEQMRHWQMSLSNSIVMQPLSEIIVSNKDQL